MTSVKDIRIETPATPQTLGTGSFHFTDDYSVFDWGVMPDTIPQKGAVLCTMGASNFELLEENGVPTHYRGVPTPSGFGSLAQANRPPREMMIDLTQVPALPFSNGEYDYSSYHDDAGTNFLVPLEIVFRNVIPIGSSLRHRSTPRELGFSFSTWPDQPVSLDDPIIEFSTKYEEQDRYLSEHEADEIAGLASTEDLTDLAQQVNQIITDQATAAGLDHQDGKIECLYWDGELRVADVAGTFDENRFAYNGQQLSKEVIRQYYKHAHPDWVEAVTDAKTTANETGTADWRSLCSQSPPSLPESVVQAASDMYCAGANTYLDTQLFDAPPLSTVITSIDGLFA